MKLYKLPLYILTSFLLITSFSYAEDDNKRIVDFGEREGIWFNDDYRYTSDRYRYPYYDKERKYPYSYWQIINRKGSKYTSDKRNDRTYYTFEDTYTDDKGYKHYYYEEFYYDKYDDRHYYIEDYYYKNNDKIYLFKEHFNENKYYRNRRYWDEARPYEDSQYENLRGNYEYFDNFRDIEKNTRPDYTGYDYDRYYNPVNSLPAPLPPGTINWPQEKDFSRSKQDVADFLTKEVLKSNRSRRRPYYNVDAVYALMSRYYPHKVDSYNEYQTYSNFLYYFGFVDDYINRYGYKDDYDREYIDTYASDFFELYYRYYRGIYTEDDINKAITQKAPTNFDEKIAKINENQYNERADVNAKILKERKDSLSPQIYTETQMTKYPNNITLNVHSSMMDRDFEYLEDDKIDMINKVYEENGRYFVPIASLGENIGIICSYNPDEKYLTMQKGSLVAKIYNGSPNILVGNTTYSMNTNSQIVNNIVMLPVDVLEHFGYALGRNLTINNYTGTINIYN